MRYSLWPFIGRWAISGFVPGAVQTDQGAWTQLMQITLRNAKPLTTHQAKEAVTIQCVSGEGTLVVGGGERIALTPGVVVLLEPNVAHAVESAPEVSVLVTRFLATQ